jgi:catechol-2,3-dioxygenase
MKKYEIEHIGISVEKPIEMANWYHEVLGFNIKFSAEDEEKGVAFLTDGSDRVMLELGKLPNVLPLTKGISHHLQLHIALKSDDPDKEAEFLVSKVQHLSKNAHQDAGGELDGVKRSVGQYHPAGEKKC